MLNRYNHTLLYCAFLSIIHNAGCITFVNKVFDVFEVLIYRASLAIGRQWSARMSSDFHVRSDCQQKNRYIQIFCHTRINLAISLKFSGPVHHPMEQLMYKFHFYISNIIAFIPPFVTYPNFCTPTKKEKVHFNSINLNTKKWLWNW